MASIDKRPDGQWRARWREYPGGPQRTKHFARKVDAQRFLTEVEHRLLSGTYTPLAAGQITVAAYAEEWVGRRSWAPSTLAWATRDLERHILPVLGQRPLASLRRSHVEEWLQTVQLEPGGVAHALGTLSALLGTAVGDERIPRNVAKGVQVAQADRPPFEVLTVDQVRRLATSADEMAKATIVTVAGTGLRQGELFGLSADRIDFLRRQLRVDRQLWTPDRGASVLRPPKSKRSYRTIALSTLVLDTLAAHIAAFPPNDAGLLFHAQGRPIDRTTGWRIINKAAIGAGIGGVAWHALRHHHASCLLSAGISPALVAERLGHDIATLLRIYAHVIRSDDDRVRAAVDATLGVTAEDWLRTSPPFVIEADSID